MNPSDERAPDIVIPEETIPDTTDGADVARVIDTLQLVVLKHPVAAQAAYRAFVAEGRRFAATEEGRSWHARLERSPEMQRLRSLWEAATFNVLRADETSALPGPFIDLIAQVVSRADVEHLTAAYADPGVATDPRSRA